MKAPAFWATDGPVARLLAPAGWLYGQLTAWRMAQAGQSAALPVICVGNLTMGGAGKTPTALMLAEALREGGETPFVISRGYRGRLAGPVVVDAAAMQAAECGDEPLLLARHVPTIVSADRRAGAALALQQGATIVLLDDGLQNPRLAKDFTVAVVDGGNPFGNGRCFPAGPLRVPISRQVAKIDCFLVIGGTVAGSDESLTRLGKPIFQAMLQPDPASIASLRGKRLLAFAGIGRPSKFFSTLVEAGLDVRAAASFGDHHPYSEAEIAALHQRAAAEGLQLVTTEKDAVRLPDRDGIAVLPVTLPMPAGLLAMAQEAIGRRRSAP
ncbi:MAG: tetraacyldisaccharide 4'-kinase [Methylocystis sp.]|nr:tetraacyldisaccharide 4'-kinase [Methylocystis sp.]MCA3582373.1 tetraacyldisaccharide 4'-kinase [Methylocystis sp.]MCA3588268.1 tetraacyldisaccharide 4'-kinase [Methylocystis sp.]MCA3590186.1 tetraacyldisaccharide 4'-kinase [Methylocystis sp.]